MKRTYITLLLAAVAMCTFAAAPNGSGTYYQNANGKKGAELKTALCRILYDSLNNPPLSYAALWDAFYTTDVCDGDKVWDMYSNKTKLTLGTNQDTGSGNAEGQYYNREHSFPQSWFGSSSPMYTDLHHIYPTDKFVNGKRSNYPFGTTNGEDYKSANNFSKLGDCTYPGYTGTVFEPNDMYKGDFARTYFYIVTCYEEQLSSWVTNYSSADVVNVLDGSKYPAFQTWQKDMLLAWATADPVSQKEIDRNNEVKRLQGNRNPFIDYPGLEQYIWGNKTDVAFSYDNYDGSGSGDDPDPGTDPNPGSAGTYKLTITPDNFNTSSYAANNNEKTSYAVCTTDATKTFEVKWTSYQVYKSSNKMQWQSGKGYIYNSTDLGTINNVTVSVYGSTSFTTYYGDSEQPSSSTTVGGGYFQTKVGNATGYTTQIEVTFTIDGGAPSPVASDLALSASSLSFDLYNDSGAKTINYTTSSTGAVTVSGGAGYVTTSVNESTKTITVAPLAKTTSPQTITVSQAADETYEAGSVTFTVTVGDSTPVPSSGEWVETPFANLTASDIFVIVGTTDNGPYAMSNDNGTGTRPAAVAVTVADGKITSDVPNNIKWSISGNATNGYVFYPNGDTSSWLYCNSDNDGVRVGTDTNKDFTIKNSYLYNNATSRYLGIYAYRQWRCYTSINANITGQTFAFYKYVAPSAPTSIPVFVSELGCGTFASDYALDFSASEIRAFYATASGDNLIFHEVEKVPANTGVLLYKVGGASDDIPVYNGNLDALSDNVFVRGKGVPVSYIDPEDVQYYNYILFDGDDGLGFYKAKNNMVATDRAYIHVPASTNVKCFLLDLENDPTGIRSMEEVRGMMEDGVIYNLAGQRLQKMQKGINIVNGKKVLR